MHRPHAKSSVMLRYFCLWSSTARWHFQASSFGARTARGLVVRASASIGWLWRLPTYKCNIVPALHSPISRFLGMVDFRLLAMIVFCGVCLHSPDARSKTQIHKCMIDGSVTFQQEPCAASQQAKPPTVQQLNAGRKKRVENAGSPTISGAPVVPVQPGLREQYSCDGRQYCTQMRSCAEAKYFLANCPGVKMDGNGDGVPCEQQWCGR